MLLDEPNSNLDVWHQLDVMRIVPVLVSRQGITALIAVHDLSQDVGLEFNIVPFFITLTAYYLSIKTRKNIFFYMGYLSLQLKLTLFVIPLRMNFPSCSLSSWEINSLISSS